MGRFSGKSQPEKSRCPHMVNAFPKRIGGTSSITSGLFRSINQVANKVNFGQSANSSEHATGKANAARSQKVTTLLLFKSNRVAPVDAIPSANKHIKHYEND